MAALLDFCLGIVQRRSLESRISLYDMIIKRKTLCDDDNLRKQSKSSLKKCTSRMKRSQKDFPLLQIDFAVTATSLICSFSNRQCVS